MKGVNYREIRGMPYVRREYIRGKPQLKIARFSSGLATGDYDFKVELLVTEKMQIRHNALEAAQISCQQDDGKSGGYEFFFYVKSISACDSKRKQDDCYSRCR